MPSRPCFLLALISITTFPIGAQSIISARAGIIHFSDGTVWLDNRPMEQHFGRFEQIAIGSELRTENGHAEVMLTPSVFLRMGEKSAIRMISNRLSDTKVELLSGSVVLDSTAATGSSPITIRFGNYEARITEQGCYRFDSNPPELVVVSGQMAVFHGSREAAMVDAGRTAPLNDGPLTIHESDRISDSLDTWNNTRNKSIAENNVSTANGKELSAVVDAWQNDSQALIRALKASALVPPMPSRSLSAYAPRSTYPTATSSTYSLSRTYPHSEKLGLSGIKSFGVVVETPPAGLGIDVHVIETYAKTLLATANLQVVTASVATFDQTLIAIVVNASPERSRSPRALNVQLEIRQPVVLERDLKTVVPNAITARVAQVTILDPDSDATTSVKASLGLLFNLFMTDYRTANP